MKKIIIVLLALAVIIPFESCEKNKHACGTKRQKRARHKKIKKNTYFMTNLIQL